MWPLTQNRPDPDHSEEPPTLTQGQAAAPDAAAPAACVLPIRRRKSIPHFAARVCGGLVSLIFLAIIAIGGLIYAGPLDLDFLREKVVAELARSLGRQHSVAVDSVHLGFVDTGLAARLDGMKVRDGDGRVVMSAPSASVSFDPLSLLSLRLQPKRLEISRLVLRLDIQPDGSVAIATGDPPQSEPVIPLPAPPSQPHDFAAEAQARRASVVTALGDLEKLFSDEGPLGRLKAVDINDGKLIVRHLGSGRGLVLDHVQITQAQVGSQGRSLTVRGVGPHGPLTVRLASQTDGDGYRTGFSADALAVSDLATVLGLPPVPADANAALTLGGTVSLDRARKAAALELSASAGPSRFSIDGTPEAMVSIDGATAQLSWNSTSGVVTLRQVGFDAGGTHVRFDGQMTPDTSGPWRYGVHLRSDRPVLEALSSTETSLTLAAIEATGSLDIVGRRIDLPTIEIKADDFSVSGRFAFQGSDEGPGIDWALSALKIPVRPALRVWPAFLAPDVRSHLVRTLSAGMLEHIDLAASMSPKVLKDSIEHRPIPEDAIGGTFAISGATMTAVDGLPPLQGAEVAGRFNGRRVDVEVARSALDLGNGRKLALSDGRFVVADTSQRPSQANISFRVRSGADAAADLLARPPLRPDRGQIIDPAQVKGNVDARVSVSLPLIARLKREDVVSSLSGTVSNLFVDKAFGNEKLEAATLSIANERHVTTAKGEGRIFGASAAISLRQVAGEAGEVTLQFAADDAVRAKRGFLSVPGLKGPVGVTVKAPVQKLSPYDEASVSLDLTKAAVDGLVPGWSKAAGKPAKISFNYQGTASGAKLENFALEGNPVLAKGQLLLDETGTLKAARFDQFRLSPGDNLKVDLDRVGKGFRVVARGSSFDARPFIRGNGADGKANDGRSGDGKGDGKDDPREVTLHVVSTLLTGFNGEAMTNADLQVTNAGTEIRQFSLDGRLNGAPVSGRLAQQGANSGVLTIKSRDAGSFLRFVDIYNKMVGGTLDLSLSGPTDNQAGVMLVRDFVLRDEPALRSVAPKRFSTQALDTDVTSTATVPAAVGDVAFTKLRADFQRQPSRVVFNDAVMWGQQVGGSINGTIDYGRDRLRLTGTFVPAYQVNNFFSQLPLVGALLGGGQHEGLFAVSFQIDGRVSAPVLRVSPLSAIAPGFLRKLFEFRQQPDNGLERRIPESNR